MDVKFEIQVTIGKTTYRMSVVGSTDGRQEMFIVTAGGKSASIVNNLPLNLSKGQKSWDARWRFINGYGMKESTQEAIIKAIQDYFEPPPPPKPPRPTPPKKVMVQRSGQGGKYRSEWNGEYE